MFSAQNKGQRTYRALRMVHAKPKDVQPKFRLLIRHTFRMNAANVSSRNISHIEHLLRKGARQIELFEDPAVRDCWVSEEMVAWSTTWKRAVT
jgi:succinate dehydrogenase assembly factor 1